MYAPTDYLHSQILDANNCVKITSGTNSKMKLFVLCVSGETGCGRGLTASTSPSAPSSAALPELSASIPRCTSMAEGAPDDERDDLLVAAAAAAAAKREDNSSSSSSSHCNSAPLNLHKAEVGAFFILTFFLLGPSSSSLFDERAQQMGRTSKMRGRKNNDHPALGRENKRKIICLSLDCTHEGTQIIAYLVHAAAVTWFRPRAL